MARKLNAIRNIGIIAHIDAGKTTVTERMLFLSGARHNVGRVDFGTTITDDDAEEQERGITIYAACVTFAWKDWQINLLDTPGHVDFTAEVERCLRVLDGAVVVFSAREGVEAQSETVWRQAEKYGVPRFAFINKMDREGANFEKVVEDIESRLGATPVPIQIPVGQGPSHVDDPFRGIIDLVEMKMLVFDTESEGKKFEEQPIPEDQLELAEAWRADMLEKLYGLSDEMMELAFAEEEIPTQLIRDTLREGTLMRQVQPVVCGSALHGVGVQRVLDSVGEFLPSPVDRPPVEGVDPKSGKEISRKADPKEPFCGLVFKILPAKTGDIYWLRIYSGELKANSRVYNPNKDKKENAAQLWQIHATKKERDGQIDKVSCGDIVGIIGPRESITGDTLCDSRNPIELPTIQFAETVISMAIEPKSAADRKKLGQVLEMLKRQDPTFSADENSETGQTIIAGMGELHLEVIENSLLRDYKLDVRVHQPRVSYRETVLSAADGSGECTAIGTQATYAKVDVRVEPFEDEEQAVFLENQFEEEGFPSSFVQATMEALEGCIVGGGTLLGFPLTRLKITLLGCTAHEEGSDEAAFRRAADLAFNDAVQKAQRTILEPIMRLEINTPEEHLGDIVNDLQQRRAIIASTEVRGSDTVVEAHAPLKELFGYSDSMRSVSRGRASCSMEPMNYAPAPEEDFGDFV